MFPASHRGTELQYHTRKKKGVMRKVQFDRKSWSPVSSVAYRLPKRTAANQRCSKEAGLLEEGKSPYPLGEDGVRVSVRRTSIPSPDASRRPLPWGEASEQRYLRRGGPTE